MASSSVTGIPMARAGASSWAITVVVVVMVDLLEKDFGDEESCGDGHDGGDESGDHEGVVEDVFSDAGGTRAVEVDGGDEGSVGGDEEVAVDGGEHAGEGGGGDSEG